VIRSSITSRIALWTRQCIWASLSTLLLKQSTSNHCLVLTYHRITNEVMWPDSLVVTPDQFACHVEFLRKRFRLLSAHEVAGIIRSGKSFPKASCLITFDDGWRDNYTQAFPILRSYQAPAIIFLATDYIGTNQRFWHERLARILYGLPHHSGVRRQLIRPTDFSNVLSRLVQTVQSFPLIAREPVVTRVVEEWKTLDPHALESRMEELTAITEAPTEQDSPAMLSWNEVATMAGAGIAFGSHTKSHVLLDRVRPSQMKDELVSSKAVIESKLSGPVDFIAYPNGNYNDAVIATSQEAGYIGGFTCDIGFNPSSDRPFLLKRKHVLNDLSLGLTGQFSSTFFAAELSGIRHMVKTRIKGVPLVRAGGQG
jgi:peptidoglycan/xylan/chitin deacetylase (PgdA/CDA1 family)